MEKKTYIVTLEYGDPITVEITEETYNFIQFLKSRNDDDLCGIEIYPSTETYKNF
jgi:hypothetical protein